MKNMAVSTSTKFAAFLFCLSTVSSAAVDGVAGPAGLQQQIDSTKVTLEKAKTHTGQMLNLDPLPNREKITPIVKAESQRVADLFKQVATTFEEKRKAEKDGDMNRLMWSTTFALNECADNLTRSGVSEVIRDMKKDDELYFRCASTMLHFAGRIVTLWDQSHRGVPCGLPICQDPIPSALTSLDSYIRDYELGFHTAVGPHHDGKGNLAHGGGHEHEHHHRR